MASKYLTRIQGFVPYKSPVFTFRAPSEGITHRGLLKRSAVSVNTKNLWHMFMLFVPGKQ